MPVAQRVQFNGNQLTMGVIFFHFINSSMPGWPALQGELPNHADNSSLVFINSVCCRGELDSLGASAVWHTTWPVCLRRHHRGTQYRYVSIVDLDNYYLYYKCSETFWLYSQATGLPFAFTEVILQVRSNDCKVRQRCGRKHQPSLNTVASHISLWSC